MFELMTHFVPRGDQPKAIEALTQGINQGKKSQVLLGVTGSGKTFTMAQIIQKINQPTLVIAHNKTLAAQLYQEFTAFFPHNAVEYFVSYYDYYQPEAYISRTDTYIEKDLAINDRIDKMRLSATRSLIERKDVIIVASVSCIYGLGTPEYYQSMVLFIKVNETLSRDKMLLHLVALHYERGEFDLYRSLFRVRGDVVEIVPSYEDQLAYRIEFFGDLVERISEIDPLTGQVRKRLSEVKIYPGSHYVTPEEVRGQAIESIKLELEERIQKFKKENKLIEEQRIRERTLYDLEMIKEIGFCKGIENYSRHFSGRKEGEPSPCFLDYFPKDFLLFIDESHQTIPQVHAMYNGDKARKEALIEFGFRLPSAYDNRPLKFEEFYQKLDNVIYVSATPGEWEVQEAGGIVVEQVVRPTGLLDPLIEVKPATGQVDDVLEEIQKERQNKGRVLVTTLTKHLAEELTKYLTDIGIKAKYLHSDIKTLERIHIINDLRTGVFDVLVGINLLREGLDLPEVTLVAILDGDKQGFLRSETALIQTCGRASRNAKGRVVIYADQKTEAIRNTISVTTKRRKIQEEYNQKHGITPKTVERSKIENLEETFGLPPEEGKDVKPLDIKKVFVTAEELDKEIRKVRKAMKKAAQKLQFEEAARLRDQLKYLEGVELLE